MTFEQSQPVAGVIVVDKPVGITSFDVVKRIRRLFRIKKVGHTGTLDPLAGGVLPICLGRATKLVPYLQAGEKVYTGRMMLGMCTDTDDITGRVTMKRTVPDLDPVDIQGVMDELTGMVEQVPPDYSAVKIDGRPAYRRARAGEKIRIGSRMVNVSSFTYEKIESPFVWFKARVSKGTYIRSLVADVGRRLATGACLDRLRRVISEPFSENQSFTLEFLENAEPGALTSDCLFSMEDALSFLPRVDVSSEQAREVIQGRPLSLSDLRADKLRPGPIRVQANGHGLIAIYEYNPLIGRSWEYLTPLRVLAVNI